MITGSPQAAASRAANPSPSGLSPPSRVRTGSTNRSACCKAVITSARGIAPAIRTVPARPRSLIMDCSRGRSGPSPTKINSPAPDAARSSRTNRQAWSSVAKPFWGTNLPTAMDRKLCPSRGAGRNRVVSTGGGRRSSRARADALSARPTRAEV
jgi:hypothetical protein